MNKDIFYLFQRCWGHPATHDSLQERDWQPLPVLVRGRARGIRLCSEQVWLLRHGEIQSMVQEGGCKNSSQGTSLQIVFDLLQEYNFVIGCISNGTVTYGRCVTVLYTNWFSKSGTYRIVPSHITIPVPVPNNVCIFNRCSSAMSPERSQGMRSRFSSEIIWLPTCRPSSPTSARSITFGKKWFPLN
jgi:hypothetical protein